MIEIRQLRCVVVAVSQALAPMWCLAAQPPSGHPIIGKWEVHANKINCVEIWEIHADGTTRNLSGEEETYSKYTISDAPTPDGYYIMVDTITQTNGRRDCSGELGAPVGDRSTAYLLPLPNGKFVMCLDKPPSRCRYAMVRVAAPIS